MMRRALVISLIVSSQILHLLPLVAQNHVAGHQVAKEVVLRNIPEEYIHKARTELVIAYQHTSHGTHVSRGVFGLQDYKTGDTLLFGVSETANDTTLEFRDYALEDYAPPGVTAIDLSVDETAFIQTTRNYLDAPENATVNVVMWSWCNIAGHDPVNNYLPGMDSLISEYGEGGTKIGTGPGQREIPVHFIYMTGHANKNANTGPLNPKEQAQLITDSCEFKQQFCLDYYSIDTHDMEDTYYEDAGDDGDSDSYGGNFYHDWQDAHVLGEHYYENKRTPGGDVVFGEHNTQHITANRKAYAFWWILARIAGWDGSYPVTSIEVSSEGDSTWVMTGSELQFYADVLPEFATDTTISWSVISRSGSASISSAGLLQGELPGDIEVVAMALDGSGVTDTMTLNVLGPLVPVSEISVIGADSSSEIATAGGSLQLQATVTPADATNHHIAWSMINGTGSAAIDSSGLVTAISNGTVTARATAKDGSGAYGELVITITNQPVLVDDISVFGAEGSSEIAADGGTLQLQYLVSPADATDTTVTWSVINGTGSAAIDSSGLVTALSNGTVTARATANDSSGVYGELVITITNQIVKVNAIEVSAEGGVSFITTEGGTLQLHAMVTPTDAADTTVTWSVINGTGSATIDSSGLVTALSNGTVTARATANDSSGVYGELAITINDQYILVSEISIMGSDSSSLIATAGGTLQLYATVTPADATDTTVSWSVINGTGSAAIDSSGLVTAISDGTVTARATANDSSGVYGELVIAITNQLVWVNHIEVSSADGSSHIPEADGTLQLQAVVMPADATDTTVTWSVINGTGSAAIDSSGLVTAISDGTVTARATANDSSGVYGDMDILIGVQDTLDAWIDPPNPIEIFNLTSTMDRRRAMPVGMPESGDIQSITIYHEGGNGGLIMGVYADDSGRPGQRLGITNTAVVSPQEGWQTVGLNAPVHVEAGVTIWLAWVFESNPGIRYRAGSPGRAQSTDAWAGGMPDSFGSSGQADYIYSIYGSYTPSGTTGTPPEPPTDLSSSGVTSNSIQLSWSDHSDNETGFEIQRSDTSGTGYSTLFTTTVNATSYLDAAVEPEHSYFYRIRAINSYGESDYTPELMVSTPAEPVGGSTLGHDEIYDIISTYDRRRAMPVGMPESGDIQSITIYHEGGNGGLIMGVYADDSGRPGQRLGITNTAVVSPQEGWQTVGLNAPVHVEAGVTIWLAWVFESNPGIRYRAGSPGRAQSTDAWAGGMPDSFGSSGQADYIYSIYGSYTPSGTTGAPPEPPTDLSNAGVTANSIQLSWSDHSNNETGFEIQRSDTSGTGYSTLFTTTVNATSYLDAAVEPEHSYFYRIRAINSYGESDYTPELMVSTPAEPAGDTIPEPPTDLSSSGVTSNSIQLSWSDHSDNETGFEIQRSDTSGTGYSTLFTTTVNATSYLDAAVEPEHSYFYRMRAINSHGESDYTPELMVSTPAEPAGDTIPEPPTDLSSSGVTSNSIQLSWSDHSDNETGFEIQRSDTSGTGYSTLFTTTVNATSYLDAAVEPEHSYFYRIRAINSHGESDYTPELMVSTPAEPVGGSTMGHDEIYDIISTYDRRRAMPVGMPESGDIQSITIYHEGGNGGLIMGVYADDSGRPGQRLGITNTAVVSPQEGWQTVGLNAPVHVEAGVTIWLAWVFESNPGIRYRAGSPGRAQSTDAWAGGMPDSFGSSGQADYIYSIYGSYTPSGTTGTPPEPPTDLSNAGVTANSIQLSWSDHSNNETGFEIQRSDTSGTGYSTLFTTTVNATSYLDAAVEPEHSYFYRIRAINSYGESDYTPELMVSTPAEPVGGSTLGHDEIYDIISTYDRRRAMPVGMPESGDIQSITIYHEGGNGGLIMGVYADDSGQPGQRLGLTNTAVVNTQPGWQTVGLNAPVHVEAGEIIWLAWVFESNPGIRYRTGSPGRAQSSEAWAGGMPVSFGTSSQADYIYSIYANYISSSPRANQSISLGEEGLKMSQEAVNIYPNPTSNEITISWKCAYAEGLILQIFNATGGMLKNLEIEPNQQFIRLHIGDFHQGIYFILLTDMGNKQIIHQSSVIKLQ
jgi:uncharacterized protein YjdB